MLPTKIVKFSHAKDVEYNVFEEKLIMLEKKQLSYNYDTGCSRISDAILKFYKKTSK